MKELLIFYIGFTAGICFMDYLDVKNELNIHLYRTFTFPLLIALILSPLIFPFYVINYINDKVQGLKK